VNRCKWARIAFVEASEKAAVVKVKADGHMSEKHNCEEFLNMLTLFCDCILIWLLVFAKPELR